MFFRFTFQQCRYLRNNRNFRKVNNPGVEKRIKMLLNSDKVSDILFDDEDDLDFELNVNESDQSVQSYKEEKRLKNEKLKMLIVKQKYFNEYYPNFLTWQEKEHIRYLHNMNSDEWTVDRLAESFPALPETIKKIIKSKWKPKSSERIANHNQNVENNWVKFKENQLDIPDILSEHLKRFLKRQNVENLSTKQLPSNKILLNTEQLPKKSEFRDLLVLEQSKTTTNTVIVSNKNSINQISNKIPGNLENKLMQIDHLKILNSLSTKSENKLKINEPCREIIPNSKINENKNSKYSQLTKNISSEHSPIVKTDYPEFIEIPKKLRIKGKTYKVEDRYYDDDGEFLYRVPGMTGKFSS